MSNSRRRYDDDDRYDNRRQSRGRSRGHGKGVSLTTIIVVVGVLVLWFNSQDTTTHHRSPSHGSTVCTQYFKGDC